MRPIRLDLSGFGAFREPTTIDFEGADFFALVGPTGSGKSTVIDAICFALYGSVPRYDDRRLIAPIVSMGASEAKVSLIFAVGDEQYQAARVVRRTKTGATTPEARLERLRDGEVLAGRANEMEAAVVGVLGLPFAHFTKCVVLPQGEFARFLHDKPADRQQLLVELLNLGIYTRMGQEARALAAQKDAGIEIQRRELEKLDALATDERRHTVEQRVKESTRVAGELDAARATLDALSAAGDAAETEATRATELVARLGEVAVPSEVRALAKERTAAEAALAEANAAVVATAAEVDARTKAVANLPDLAGLVSARDAHRDLATMAKELTKQRAAVEAAAARAVAAEAGFTAAETRRVDAAAAQEALRTEHRAHSVAQTLHAGDTCPVCRQVVTTLPKLTAPAGVKQVDRELEQATKALDQATRQRDTARIAAETARQTVVGIERREHELAARVKGHPDAAALDARIAAAEECRVALDRARRADDGARKTLDQARSVADSFAGRVKQATAQFRAQRDPLLQLGTELPEMHDDLLDDWDRLEAWAGPQAEASALAAATARERLTATQGERRVLLTRLAEACAALEVGVAAPVTIERLVEAVVRAEHDAQHEQAEIKRAVTEAKKLRKAVGAAEEEATVAKTLGQLLRASEFEKWLVAEALDVLVADASHTLQELSAGQYSLTFDETSRDFLVVDHRNADERRSVRTLSGGETFQASLALALALSDQLRDLAADGAARLESIFLDEGFGSLDPDTLDTVAATIETLAIDERMVGLITHVAELSDRVPVRFVVAKGPRTATVEKVLT